jgi:integrase
MFQISEVQESPAFNGRWSSLTLRARQKNDTQESIPLVPAFDALLQSVPLDDRTGYVFQPRSLEGLMNRPESTKRLTAEWCGRIVSLIGKAANIVVHPGDAKTNRPTKFASAHDLRRSCAERMVDAGVPERIIQRIMRHANFETTRKYYSGGTVQREAAILYEKTAKDDSTQVHFEGESMQVVSGTQV